VLEAIERDGISWKGPVVIVGHDGDIPAWLFVTSDRISLTNRDTILLESPRSWLVPAPSRIEDSGIRLSITPEGVVPGRGATERLLLMVLDGEGPANQLAAILTGKTRRQRIDAEMPDWKPGVGAGRSSSLPPLPAFEASQDAPPPAERATGDAEARGVAPIDEWSAPRREKQQPAIPFRAPEPEPVEPQSHAARFLTNRPEADAPVEPRPEPNTAKPARVTPIAKERRKRRAGAGIWLTRVAMLAIIVLVAGWFARPYLPDEVTDRLPAAIVGDQGGDGDDVALQSQDTTNPTNANTEQGDGTNGAGTSPTDIMPTEAALGVGGATTDAAAGTGGGETGPDDSVLPTPTPPEADAGANGAEPTTDPGASGSLGNEALNGNANEDTGDSGNPVGGNQPEPTQPPAEETEVATEAPAEETEVATEPPVEETEVATEPPVEETEVATEAPIEPTIAPVEPTEAPIEETEVATQEPTEIPATPTAETVEPTATETAEATEAAATAPAEPTLESQPASVNPEVPPAQEFVQDGIRYSIDGSASGSSLPELPEINAVTYGEWIVLAVDGQNLTSENQVFDMRAFTLLADGAPIQVDVGNSWVASMMGYTPAYGNTDAILWAPGEQHQFVLTFLAPQDAGSLVLQAGDQQFDLTPIIETSPSLANMQESTVPETIDATVVDVIDGETIVIEKDGIQQTVRYLGIETPTGDDCYATEASDANRSLVEGKAVKIERQATDVDAQGNWVRDVWVQQDDGNFALVAHQLVLEGAATADISEPNTRFASWLRGADAVAQAEGRGLWSGCQQGSTPANDLLTAQPADRARPLTA
jgi:endonuclease YncB( thermonuclease family)